MSHNVMIKGTQIKNMAVLTRAIEELRSEGVAVSLDNSGTFRTYPGQDNRADYTIRLEKESYDIGLKKAADGSYQPIIDSDIIYASKTLACEYIRGEKREDRDCIGKLMQRYGVLLMEDEATNSGYTSTRSVGEKGQMLVEVEMD